jgi:hypothetical protein
MRGISAAFATHDVGMNANTKQSTPPPISPQENIG